MFMGMIQCFVAFLGRALLSIIFISSAVNKLLDWNGTLQFFNQALSDRLAMSIGTGFMQELAEWAIANAFVLLLAGVLFELIGGLLVFFGISVRLGAVLLIIFLIPTTFLFHNFWDLQGMDRQMQMTNFMKNLSIGGGLLYLLAMGKGKKCPPKKSEEKKPAAP